MNSDTPVKSSDTVDALAQLIQWSRSEREDIKRDLETEYADAEAARMENQKTYRALSQSYIAGEENIDTLRESLYDTYGAASSAIKNHLENLESAIVNSAGGVMTSGTSYMSEYFSLTGELADVIGRAWQARYAAELAAREAEWEQQVFDIDQKLKSWREAAGVILANGRDDWKRGLENMRARYSAWIKEFSQEYAQTAAVWDAAYLAGLEDKAAWVAEAGEAAGREASLDALDAVGAGAEQKARALDTRDPSAFNRINGILEAEKSLNEILRSASLLNTAEALGAAGGSALTAASAARTGVGGVNVWNAGTVQLEAAKMARESNEALAAREAKTLAANYKRMALDALDGLKDYVDEANRNFDEGMDETFIVEGRWSRSGKNYTNSILIGASLAGGKRASAAVEAFRYYRMETVSLKTAVDESRLETLDSFAVQLLIKEMGDELKGIQEEIFGTEKENKEYGEMSGEERSALSPPGLFGSHTGYGPKTKANPDVTAETITEDNIFVHKGSGETGRLISKYIYWKYRESFGFTAIETATWDKPVWDDSGSFFKAPTIRGIAEIGMQVVGAIVAAVAAPFTGGASLLAYAALSTVINMTDDAVFTALDVAGGYKDGAEAGVSFATKSAATFASSLVSASFSGLNLPNGRGFTGITERLTGNMSEGLLKTAATAGMTGVQAFTTGTVTSAISSIKYTKDGGFEYDTDGFLQGVKGAGISALAAGASVAASGLLGNVNLKDGINKELNGAIFNTQAINKLNSTIGGVVSEATGYGFSGEFTLNLANLGILTDGKVNRGLLELHLGKDGTSMNLGTGGVDVSLETLTLSALGLSDAMRIGWAKASFLFGYEKGISMLNSVNGLANSNDADNTSIARAIWQKKLKTEFVEMYDRGGYDVTKAPDTIYLNSNLLGNDREKALKLASVLAHEGTHIMGNNIETIAYFKAYNTYLALAENYGFETDKTFLAETVGKIINPQSMNDNAPGMQHWTLTREGLKFDDSGYLKNEKGEYYYNDGTFGTELNERVVGAAGVETGLMRILGINENDPKYDEKLKIVQSIMMASGMKHSDDTDNKNWYWTGTRKTANSEENLSDINKDTRISAVALSLFGMVKLSASNITESQIDKGMRIYTTASEVLSSDDVQPGWPSWKNEQELKAEAIKEGRVYETKPGLSNDTWCNRATERMMANVLGTEYASEYLRNGAAEATANVMGANLSRIFNDESLSALEAQWLANQGEYVVASWINPAEGERGHIATIASNYDWFIPGLGPKTVQAGSYMGTMYANRGFGRLNLNDINYYKIKPLDILPKQ
jgi:hypothetical protein